jgi:hypothetical protein
VRQLVGAFILLIRIKSGDESPHPNFYSFSC